MDTRLSRISAAAVVIAAMLPFSARAAAPAAGTLVKLACPAGNTVTHPCRAVYYAGGDGKRHAFPNEATYFSWYADFSSVKTIAAADMAALPLGENVTLRPGVKMAKFVSEPTTYVVALGGVLRPVPNEAAAANLYGSDWNQRIIDIDDANFGDYRFGDALTGEQPFVPAAETALAATINDNLPSAYHSLTVATPVGSYSVQLVKFQRSRFSMVTSTAQGADCSAGCAVKPLADYVTATGAAFGIHGSYFCPPDYADCAFKKNSFLWPLYDTVAGRLLNAQSMQWHHGPMLWQDASGLRYAHRTAQVPSGAAFTAGIANYPSLLEGGIVVAQGEEMLDDGMKTVKASRGGIGYNDRFGFLVLARNATVPDLAEIMRALGATDAMNLDGGGTSALWYGGGYKAGPGRELANAITFKAK